MADGTGELVGYLVLSRYVDAWHVMNVAVEPAHRRRGVASALLGSSSRRAIRDAQRGYTLEVRVSNVAAIALYERFGFAPAACDRGYYTDNREDAIIMWRDAGRSPPARRTTDEDPTERCAARSPREGP